MDVLKLISWYDFPSMRLGHWPLEPIKPLAMSFRVGLPLYRWLPVTTRPYGSVFFWSIPCSLYLFQSANAPFLSCLHAGFSGELTDSYSFVITYRALPWCSAPGIQGNIEGTCFVHCLVFNTRVIVYRATVSAVSCLVVPVFILLILTDCHVLWN